jgi:hypothetical protein
MYTVATQVTLPIALTGSPERAKLFVTTRSRGQGNTQKKRDRRTWTAFNWLTIDFKEGFGRHGKN